jgi:hypothetical protein
MFNPDADGDQEPGQEGPSQDQRKDAPMPLA